MMAGLAAKETYKLAANLAKITPKGLEVVESIKLEISNWINKNKYLSEEESQTLTRNNTDNNNENDRFDSKQILNYELDQSQSNSSSNQQTINEHESVNNLLALSSLMTRHINSDDFLSSESRLVHSKFQRLFHFLLTDVHNEPIIEALGDHISTLADVDDALIHLNRNATLKFRNYRKFIDRILNIFFLLNRLIVSFFNRYTNSFIFLLDTSAVLFLNGHINSFIFKWIH